MSRMCEIFDEQNKKHFVSTFMMRLIDAGFYMTLVKKKNARTKQTVL
jgi:hypothetical protein